MVIRAKILWTVLSLVSLIAIISVFYIGFRKILSLPFRQTNDLLHAQGFPLTLDLLIPEGRYIDETMTVKEVLHYRLHKPSKKYHLFLSKVSENIPVKYRVTATTVFYLFWTLLFLVFFRIFTWMRYTTALFISFLFGAVVYFFMPDFIIGKIDDSIFVGWALALLGLRLWMKRKNVKGTQ
jgi:hypothetical protein